MWVPALYAFSEGNAEHGRLFVYSAILGTGLTVAIGVAVSNRRFPETRRMLLLNLVFTFAILPLGLAIPMREAIATTSYLNAYLDAVSAITTTALPTFDPDRLSPSLILYRSIIAWLGGLFLWVFAWVLFMPLRLGGYEIVLQSDPTQNSPSTRPQETSLTQRFWTELFKIFPIYTGVTVATWFLLIAAGSDGFEAIIFAMGTISTAGYTPNADSLMSPPGVGAEIIVFFALCFNVSRALLGRTLSLEERDVVAINSELKVAVVLVSVVAIALFLRQFIGAATVDTSQDAATALRAFWGGLFTALSFLTTTGYVSSAWADAQAWSGLSNPTTILLALSIIGGGVATSAGGLKLLRVQSLLQHSAREIIHLAEPRRILPNRTGALGGKVRNAVWAWVFFMSFLFAFGIIAVLISWAGTNFETTITLTTAALSNTGPLVNIEKEYSIDLLTLGLGTKLSIIVAMILGRVETLAVFALLNPDIWRR